MLSGPNLGPRKPKLAPYDGFYSSFRLAKLVQAFEVMIFETNQVLGTFVLIAGG